MAVREGVLFIYTNACASVAVLLVMQPVVHGGSDYATKMLIESHSVGRAQFSAVF